MFLLSQIFGLLALLIAIVSVQLKKKAHLLFLQIIENLVKIIALALVGGIAGAFTETIGLIRKTWFYKNSRINKKNNLFSLLFFCALGILAGASVWHGYITLFAIAGLLLGTVGYWQDNIYILRYFTLLGSINYGLYSLFVGAYTNAISEVFVIVSIIISLVRFKYFKKINYSYKIRLSLGNKKN
jgi:hypothetical protein